jgi:hypothetical protein
MGRIIILFLAALVTPVIPFLRAMEANAQQAPLPNAPITKLSQTRPAPAV